MQDRGWHVPGVKQDQDFRAESSTASRDFPICGCRSHRMTKAVDPERRVLANGQRAVPVHAAACAELLSLHQYVASGSSGKLSGDVPRRGSGELGLRLGASQEVSTASCIGHGIPTRIEAAGHLVAGEDSLRRNAVRLVRERLERGPDGPLPRNGRKQVRDEVKSALSFGDGRWRRAAP